MLDVNSSNCQQIFNEAGVFVDQQNDRQVYLDNQNLINQDYNDDD